MKRLLLFLSGLAIIAYYIFVQQPTTPIEKIILTGSSTVAPLMTEIAYSYETDHPNVKIDVQTGGSSRGISDARSEVAHIGMVSRNPKQNESDLHWYPIARDGLSIIVHKNNPISSISSEKIKKIYMGQLKQWDDISNKYKGQIVVVNKAAGRSTLEVFLKYFNLENKDIKADVIIGDNQQAIKTVIGNPNAIAYVSIGTAEYEYKSGSAIKLLSIDGQPASVSSVAANAYPILRTLNIVTKKDRPLTEAQKDFIKYATSQLSHPMIKSQNFVPIKQ